MLKLTRISHIAAPEINISQVPYILSGSKYFVPVTPNSCQSSVYDILLKFENLPVIVTSRNESCRSHMKSCRTVTDDRRLFHALFY